MLPDRLPDPPLQPDPKMLKVARHGSGLVAALFGLLGTGVGFRFECEAKAVFGVSGEGDVAGGKEGFRGVGGGQGADFGDGGFELVDEVFRAV
jgi:hypothetical protein